MFYSKKNLAVLWFHTHTKKTDIYIAFNYILPFTLSTRDIHCTAKSDLKCLLLWPIVSSGVDFLLLATRSLNLNDCQTFGGDKWVREIRTWKSSATLCSIVICANKGGGAGGALLRCERFGFFFSAQRFSRSGFLKYMINGFSSGCLGATWRKRCGKVLCLLV